MAKQVLIFWGIKVADFCQEVLNFLGSYTRVFTVSTQAQENKVKGKYEISTRTARNQLKSQRWRNQVVASFVYLEVKVSKSGGTEEGLHLQLKAS